jgi:polyprenyl P-hydroxybenzoate/phenylacrylic acid decarboxylase-like protein
LNLTLAITGASGAVFAREMLRALEADARVRHVNLVASESSLRVLAEELKFSGRNDLVGKLLGPDAATRLGNGLEDHSGGTQEDSGPAPRRSVGGYPFKVLEDSGEAASSSLGGHVGEAVGDGVESYSGKIVQLAENDIGGSIASGSYDSSGMIVLPCSMGTLAGIANGLAQTLIGRAADVCLKERRPLVLCVRETPFNRIHLRNMTLAADAGATIFPVIPAFYNHPVDSTEMARQFAYRVLGHLGLPQDGMYRWKAE